MSRILDYVLTPEEAEKLCVVDGINLPRLRELADAERDGRVRIIKDEDDKCLNCVYYLGIGECSASDGACGGTNFHCDWYERKPNHEAERALAAADAGNGATIASKDQFATDG